MTCTKGDQYSVSIAVTSSTGIVNGQLTSTCTSTENKLMPFPFDITNIIIPTGPTLV